MPKVSNKINYETDEVSFYKFVCKNPDIMFSYVGHTTNFASRKGAHKSHCNNPNDTHHNVPLYVFMRENGSWINWDMVQIHSRICKDSLEARQIEQELIEQQQFKLNAIRAFVTEEQKKERNSINKSEYREQNKEQIAEYAAEYYQQNKEKIVTYIAEYREQYKAEIAIQTAEYREQHKAEIAIQRAENRDTINAKRRAKRALLKAQLNCEI